MDSFSLFVLIVFSFFGLNSGMGTEMIYDRIEMLNSTYQEGIYNFSQFRVTKYNRTAYTINAYFELFIDLDQDFAVKIDSYYNRLNNNQYTKSLLHAPKTSICFFFDRFYGVAFSHLAENQTNFPPYKAGEKICPIKKVQTLNTFRFREYDSMTFISLLFCFRYLHPFRESIGWRTTCLKINMCHR